MAIIRIRHITPTVGSLSGGTTVEIYLEAEGTNITTVTFGGSAATIKNATATVLTVETTSHAAGNVDVYCATAVPGEEDTLKSAFLYSNTALDSPVGNYLVSLQEKFQTSSWAIDSDNVIVGESRDLLSLPDSSFPRLEILITKDKANGYGSQRNIDFDFRYSVAGYIRRPVDDVVTQDMLDSMNFGTETRALNYSFLDDKQQGHPPCVGFTRLGEYPETFYEYELFPKITAFIFEMSAFLYLTDTQVA